jgi:hypothetical protein
MWTAAMARLMVVLLTVGAALPFALHTDTMPDACDLAGGPGTVETRVQTAIPVDASGHCDVCHWLRLLRGFDAVTNEPLPRLIDSSAASAPTQSVATLLTIAGVPARAPPA